VKFLVRWDISWQVVVWYHGFRKQIAAGNGRGIGFEEEVIKFFHG